MNKVERNRTNVRNWRARKAQEGHVRIELYLSPDLIDDIRRELGPDGSAYGLPGQVVKLLGHIAKSDNQTNISLKN